jgi:acyl carrier protein phosphodiesterase
MLEESKRRNMDFLQMIELEFKKKDDLTHQLEQSVKELQQRYDELEERHESKLE